MHVFHADSALPYTYKLYEAVSETQFFNVMMMVSVYNRVYKKLISLSMNEGKLFFCSQIYFNSMYLKQEMYLLSNGRVVNRGLRY